jgi:hypothetical protein
MSAWNVQLDGFSRKLIWGTSTKICLKKSSSVKAVQHYKAPASQISIISAHSACVINTSTATQHNSVPFTVAITHSAFPAIWHYAVRHTCYCVQKYIANNASGQALPCGMRFLRNSVSRIQSSLNTTPVVTRYNFLQRTRREQFTPKRRYVTHCTCSISHVTPPSCFLVWRSELLDN